MNAPVFKGWCPSALKPMESGDGFLVRIKPRMGTFTAGDVNGIAHAARLYGNGLVDLTNRGNVQIRGLSEKSLPLFSDWVVASGLAAPDPVQESIRNILVSPLGPDDPHAAFDSHHCARAVQAVLESSPAVHSLPDKFGIAVDAGGRLPLAGAEADIVVRADGLGCRIEVAGAQVARKVSFDAATSAVQGLLNAFTHWIDELEPDDPVRGRSRFADIVADRGEGWIFIEAGVAGSGVPVPEANDAMPQHMGFHPLDESGAGFFGMGAPFGQLDANGLDAIAGCADRHGDGTIRMTPWKSIILAGVFRKDANELAKASEQFGWIATDTDSRRGFVACSGRPGCRSALADTRALAARLAPCVSDSSGNGGGLVHVSGCPKGCAHPRAASTTVVATADGFDVVRNGSASDQAERMGISFEMVAALITAQAPDEGSPKPRPQSGPQSGPVS